MNDHGVLANWGNFLGTIAMVFLFFWVFSSPATRSTVDGVGKIVRGAGHLAFYGILGWLLVRWLFKL